MRNLKKILALVLAMVMVLSMMVTANAAFADADAIEHTEAVEVMSALGILQGDGTNFNPNGTLTRAQAATIISKMMEKSVANISTLVDAVSNPFSDVPAWAEDFVLYCYSKGVVIGTGADKYSPSKELTGYEFGKMLLVASGLCEAADFATDWKVVVATELKEAGLLAGLTDLVLSQPLSREHAAQMAFNTMIKGVTKDVYRVTKVVDGETVNYDFDNQNDALLFLAINDGSEWVGKKTLTTGTMLGTIHKVSRDTDDVDAFAHPGTSYYRSTANGGYIYLFYTDAAMATYTGEGFTTAELTKLQNAGYDFSNALVYVNGSRDALTMSVSDLAARSYTGVNVTLYNHLDAVGARTVDKVVLEQGYLTYVTSVVSGNVDPTLNSISLAVFNPWDADDITPDVEFATYYDDASTTVPSVYDYLVADGLAYGSVLMTYWANADVEDIDGDDNLVTWEDVTGALGVVSAYKLDAGFNGTVVCGGTTYKMASAYAEYTGFGGALNLGKEYTLVLDANGYVIGAFETDPTIPTIYYGIALDYAYGNGTPASNMTGAPAAAAYERVKLYTAAGKVEIFETAFTYNTTTLAITNRVASALDSDDNGVLVAYTLDANGKIATITPVTTTNGGLSGAYVKGTAFATVSGGTMATDKTVVFLLDSDISEYTGNGDIEVYTGYANVPAATYTQGSAIAANVYGAGAVTASLSTLPGGVTTNKNYALFLGAPTVTAGATPGTYVYTYDVILNGEKTTVYDFSDSCSAKIGEIWEVEFNTVYGNVVAVGEVVDGTFYEITAVASGFYTCNGSAVYTDKDTVYYVLTGTTGAGSITNIKGYAAVDGITLAGLGQTFEIYEYYVSSNSVANAADVVFYFVYQP